MLVVDYRAIASVGQVDFIENENQSVLAILLTVCSSSISEVTRFL